ncbi:MAG TPA: 50S ribosomal protein L29 [Pyrinomonadaceae bacterium]|nr:50S ribosomal protein L29 [Pyrinomonadaceae bacterium]
MKRREEIERLTGMSDEELREEAVRLKESIFRLNFKLALGDMEAVRTVRRERKNLARVQTLMRQRAAAQAAG